MKSEEKNFDQITSQNIERLVAKIEKTNYNESTKNRYKKILKMFCKWLDKLELVEKIKLKPTHSRLNPENLLTEKEIKALIEAADNVRDKALIAVLYDSGCRIGEFLIVKLKDIKFDKYGAIILVNRMKNQREVRIVKSAPALKQWINEHPFRNDPEAFLWISKNHNKLLSYASLRQIIRNLAKKANIKKK